MEAILEYLVTTNWEVVNRDKKPTFSIRKRQEVIDLTVGTPKISFSQEMLRPVHKVYTGGGISLVMEPESLETQGRSSGTNLLQNQRVMPRGYLHTALQMGLRWQKICCEIFASKYT